MAFVTMCFFRAVTGGTGISGVVFARAVTGGTGANGLNSLPAHNIVETSIPANTTLTQLCLTLQLYVEKSVNT